MQLLDLIFPSLKDKKPNYILPIWSDHSFPWQILSPDEENSINNQIINLDIVTLINRDKANNITLDISNGPIHIDETAKIGEYVRIEGPSFIGKNAEIRHSAYLRKGSWICENAVVGHCSEIKNSVLLPGSKAPHFNYVGDSILGFDVNIGAGVKLSNVRNDRRSIMVELINGDKIDTKLMKFGALIGDGSELGCNVVSNPGTILEPGIMIHPNITLSGWNSKLK